MSSEKTLKITLTKSIISTKKKQRATIKALGLRKMHQTVEQKDSPVVRGMLDKVSHLVTVEEVKS